MDGSGSKAVEDLVTHLRENLLGGAGDATDIILCAKFMAGFDSAAYWTEHMTQAHLCNNTRQLYDYTLDIRTIQGLTLEFGVASGRTLTQIAQKTEGPVYGFDSFKGLPENWKYGRGKGAFARNDFPKVPSNAELVIGYFNETLGDFVASHSDPISYLHVDCDLYSSTKTIFDYLGSQIIPGTIIVFNEYFNYPGWRHHEYKAFQEYVAENGVTYEYSALNRMHQQVCVKILSTGIHAA